MNIKIKNEELDRLSTEDFKVSLKAPVHIILDNVRSAQNVGSIFRTMDAFRCAKLHICGISAKPPHREINKTALGSTESIDWTYYNTTKEALEKLREEGVVIWAIEQTRNALMLDDFKMDYSLETAFIFGNEVEGVQQEIVDLADGSIEIPQHGSKHSLNIAVCAGIVIWHAVNSFEYEI
ncbi:RNA methyltransferase [Cryomorpha ignava]|uniref:RNA methyltransferase n=1 Tax=Cryomorpha ignava TaxID=101383 RepID=A0A7K3WQS5_9FLAO|nr:RNA methyltransferase [Cryomorpha ignava]NEN24023.1 RNA methyltransferase [Cryomorpha ignava]